MDNIYDGWPHNDYEEAIKEICLIDSILQIPANYPINTISQIQPCLLLILAANELVVSVIF